MSAERKTKDEEGKGFVETHHCASPLGRIEYALLAGAALAKLAIKRIITSKSVNKNQVFFLLLKISTK